MQSSEACFFSIAEASELIAANKLSPVELLDAHLDRIDRTEARLNSFVTLLRDESIAEARKAEQAIQSGNYLGPLHGIPVGLKDLYSVNGVRTTVGSKILQNFTSHTNAEVTQRFRKAGAIIIGKLQMHEFALGATGVNPHYGPTHNPWDLDCVTGGSSSGSGSAVASGQCMAALGTDTGGSVRIPSCLCGIVGLKPSFGRISRYGVYPLSWSLDTVGPMTRTVRDSALVLNSIAGYDNRDPSSRNIPAEDFSSELNYGVSGIRVGIPDQYFFDIIDPEVEDAVRQAGRILEGLGASVENVSVPVLEHSLSISNAILLAEAAEVHLGNLRARPNDIGDDVRSRLQTGAMIPATHYIKAQRSRAIFNRELSKTMRKYHILLSPTVPVGAPKIEETMVKIGDKQEAAISLLSRLTRPFNISGMPAISIPCGFTSLGMPIGLQIAGRPYNETTVLRVAHAYEQATYWHKQRPGI